VTADAAIVAAWRERVRAATAEKPLCLRGGGSKDFYGGLPTGEILDTREYAGIIDYEPTELAITVRCGTPLAEVEAALGERQQMLACEPPRFGAATLGGTVAAGLSGPRRAAAGAVRDFVLGVRMMDGEGRVLQFGGRVMKNVAGYDVSRLMAGTLGTLGLILEVSLKVLPRPAAETTLRLEMAQTAALAALNRWAGQPLPISASCWHDGVIMVRLSGARAAVAAARAKLGGETLADGEAFWESLREQRHPFFAGTAPLWRLSLPSVAMPFEFDSAPLVEWGGSQRWLRGEHDAEGIRAVAARAGGHAVLFRGAAAEERAAGVFAPLPAPLLALQRRIKAAFDARGVFNPGRLYPLI